MGTDCTVIIEANDKIGKSDYWEPIGVFHLPRCYEFFDLLRTECAHGYPENVNLFTKEILEKYECWGEGYTTYTEYIKLMKKADMGDAKLYKPIRKSIVDKYELRVVFRFDN